MDGKPFEPADGISPRWQKLYDLVISKQVDEEISYREAMAVLDVADLRMTQAAMREARHHLEKNGERTVGTVARFGWVVLRADRELQQVDRQLTKTRRAAGRTVRGAVALNSRREELSQFERERLDRTLRSATVAAQVTGRRSMTELKQLGDQSA